MFDASWSWLKDHWDIITWISNVLTVVVVAIWLDRLIARKRVSISVKSDQGSVGAGGRISSSRMQIGERDALPGDPSIDPPKPRPPRGR
jgi:hypothetical protein